MNTGSSSITVKFDGEVSSTLMTMSRQLNTTPDRVIAQALVLLQKVQGKKIILKDGNNPVQTEINRYVK